MSSLWMGADHLVYVKGTGIFFSFSEEYQRFPYREIQAFAVAKTGRIFKILLYLFGLLCCLGMIGLIFAVAGDESFGMGQAIAVSIFSTVALTLLAMLARHLILGPTCICDIQTCLSKVRIRPLERFHATREVITRIEEKISEAQEGLLDGGGAAAVETRQATTKKAESFSVSKILQPTFAAFAVFSLISLTVLHLESLVLTGIALFAFLPVGLFLILALIASVRRATPQSLRSVLWILLGILFFLMGAGAVYFLFTATKDPSYTIGILGPLEAFASILSNGGLTFYLIFLILMIGMFLTAIGGMINASFWSRQIAQTADGEVVEKEAPDE